MLIHKEMEDLYPKFKYFCMSVTGNSWDAEDLAHDSMLKALRYCQKDQAGKRQPSFPLLTTIARNHWIDQLRKKSRETLGEAADEPTHEKPLEQLLSGLDTLMERLTPKQLLVFVLKDIFEYRLSDIADSLELNETAVKSLLHRARRKLNMNEMPEIPASTQEWEQVDADWFQRQLLVAIRMEQPELLKRLAVALRTEKPATAAPTMRTVRQPTCNSLFIELCAA
ncbi:sigma-70 family RNA polymerase sigma factor [Paenibacillus sp.]|jgi:RNA polymerase sigma-70 factor (ECF subfamily)|uniref:sigma-70 family RNA polymerase sigma factor n=1 Tax=Paenibacillus sp. TaxID=58172 RepID=UPI0028181BB5|nr:sigma-70 family RNA polymerase sigma factor [Paenibacillus sp.]MDR0266917.1 sigma-70 family RNA polymerase sigma factor [Paenibacillus sp.]